MTFSGWKFVEEKIFQQYETKLTVLVTGDRGRLGSRVRALLENDWRYEVDGYDSADGFDIRDYRTLRDAVEDVDIVIHLAAIPHPQKGSAEAYFRINVEGTFNVLQASAEAKVRRVVYSSSTGYYGCDTNIHGRLRPLYLPIDEKHPPAAAHQQFYGWLSVYNQSKVMAEQLMALYGTNQYVQTVVLRVGPANSKAEQYPKFNGGHLKKDDWRLNVMMANCHPDYAAEAIVRAANLSLELPDWSVYNIVDRYLPKGFTPQMALTHFGIETDKCLFDISKAERVLGWRPCEER